MPQEFNILQCYKCKLFQVHFVKKDTKWSCKVCSEKQSLKHVFFRWRVFVLAIITNIYPDLAGE